MDKKLGRKQLGALTAAGLVVATLCAGVAFVFTGGSSEQPKRDTVPVGQLVDVTVSSTPSSSTELPAVAADPIQKDTAVPNQPAPQQTVQQPAPAPANQPPADTEPTHPPFVPTSPGETAPEPPAPAPCYMDDSDPVNYPNGRMICP